MNRSVLKEQSAVKTHGQKCTKKIFLLLRFRIQTVTVFERGQVEIGFVAVQMSIWLHRCLIVELFGICFVAVVFKIVAVIAVKS